ncbi:hypothetical protein [Bradyrhizobium sp. SSUT77]|uniref:hypothetical protein n=1 Tax=Bradyrhizobium sp. SSUT77 TaxID=3040603 RepID=UPI0024480BC9|nr:hypothetical protein [Bradyrhizobium sp. SSUT77]MDH2346770.1 hypothetical protein [Bradyrhizobium sp. SSUT77]
MASSQNLVPSNAVQDPIFGTTRRPGKHHLDDPGTRYLLITNADATGVARDLLVHGLEEWPEEQIFPASLSGTLPHGPEGRIGIWGVRTERLLDLEINDILGSLLRVPQSRRTECRARLRDEALLRMRGMSPGVWTREDLLWRLSGQRSPTRDVRAAGELPSL